MYVIDEPIEMGKDVYPHPGSTMDENAEFLTKRPLKVKRVCSPTARLRTGTKKSSAGS